MPDDTTPDPRDMTRVPGEQQIPQGSDEAAKPDISKRPAVPEHPRPMAADRNEADPDPARGSERGMPADGNLNRG